MRKSFTMLVLMALILTSLFMNLGDSEGAHETFTDEIDNGLTDNLALEDGRPQNDVYSTSEGRNGGDVLIESSPTVYYYGTENDVQLQPFDATRGAVNTSTLMYIKKAPKKVYYMENFIIEGELLEDNNSDGEKNSGDYPLANEWVQFIWSDNTPFLVNSWNVTDENGTWKINLTADLDSISPQGDPNGKNPGVEFVVSHMGSWTTSGQGSMFYNLTQKDFDKLWDKAIGRDDDGDAAIKQYNEIDDDNDGVIDDGRPGIPAFGAPEPSHLWYNGVDDDGDGIIDDGYPGIPIMGDRKEGVDEEDYNGLDDDGDGFIDEDPWAFIARRPSSKTLFIEIWHKTKITIEVEPDLVDVGKGESVRVTGTLEDTSVPDYKMGPKTVRLFWDGNPVAETIANPQKIGFKSEFEFIYTPPWTTSAGPHDISVEFSPAFNKTNNYFYDPSNATAVVYVRRPTGIIFDNIDPLYGVTWVYRGQNIFINGTIVDKFMYERQFIQTGPQLSVKGVDYGTKYRYSVQWGEPLQSFARMWSGLFLIRPDGTFSIEYQLPANTQPLGPVTVTVETNFDQSRFHDPLIYYSNAKNQTTFIVRSRTEIELFLDQNNNELNDEMEQTDSGEPLNTFITRKPFTGLDGKVYDWNIARIRGMLKDVEQSVGALKVGVPNQKVRIFWGFGQTWQQTMEIETDQNGRFFWPYTVPPTHPLGPVPILAVYTTDYYTTYFDSSSVSDFDGKPFSVVSFTDLDINASIGIKGQAISVRGILKDDRGVGIGNRTITVFRRDTWDGSFAQIRANPGTRLGEAVTDATGKFIFREYVLEDRVNVGSIWIVARFAGSVEFPDPTTYIRYYPNDAYMPALGTPSKLVVTSETEVVLRDVPTVLVRGGEARLIGNVYESFQGKKIERGVAGQAVTAYLKQGDEILRIGVSRTRTDPEFNGYFEIKTTNVPDKLSVGEVTIIVEFTPELGPDGIPLYQVSRSEVEAQIWSQTRIQDIYFGPKDEDNDRRYDLREDQIKDWVFTFQVIEGSPTDTRGEPVQFGIVWMNITVGPYTNSTRLQTDLRGRVNFNYTSKFKDSNTGVDFQITDEQNKANMTISVKFVGKQYYRESVRIYPATYHRAKTEPPVTPPVLWILLVIFLILLIGIVALFFFYRWIEKRRRLKALKKIIKKAADQLETGNPYSAVIFRAYQKLGAHFRKYGFLRRDADTFREFEDAVRSALPIDDNSLNAFLDILEEARYSKHVIGEDHKESAIKALRGVERSLDNIILDEEAALRQMEIQDEDYVETEIVLKGNKGA